MKNLSLRKLLTLVSVMAITTFGMNVNTYAFANGYKHVDKNRHSRIFKKLNLSEQQKEQIKAIRENRKPELQNLRELSKNLRQQKNALDPVSSVYVSQVENISSQQANILQQRASIKAQIKHEVSLVLTPEQRAKAQVLKAERKAKRQERSQRRGKRRKH